MAIKKSFSADLVNKNGKVYPITDGTVIQHKGDWDEDGARADVERLYAGQHLTAKNVRFHDAN